MYQIVRLVSPHSSGLQKMWDATGRWGTYETMDVFSLCAIAIPTVIHVAGSTIFYSGSGFNLFQKLRESQVRHHDCNQFVFVICACLRSCTWRWLLSVFAFFALPTGVQCCIFLYMHKFALLLACAPFSLFVSWVHTQIRVVYSTCFMLLFWQ